MTTIRMVDPATVEGRVREIFDAALRRERTVFGATEISNIWRCMGHSANLLEANWNRSRALMQRGDGTGRSHMGGCNRYTTGRWPLA